MTTITNIAAVLSAIIVTSYSTNLQHSDNAKRKSWTERGNTLMWPAEANDYTVTAILTPATERYEQVTIREHKTIEVTLTNGLVLRQELTNRVVSDRIRTFQLIATEKIVDEKDAPKSSLRDWPINSHAVFLAYTNTNRFEWNPPVGGREDKP